MALFPSSGAVQMMFQGDQPLDPFVETLQEKFSTFFYGEGRLEEAVAPSFYRSKKNGRLSGELHGRIDRLEACRHSRRFEIPPWLDRRLFECVEGAVFAGLPHHFEAERGCQ